jgi:3',5'-cyclic AMP phosphodiesterase CpdA
MSTTTAAHLRLVHASDLHVQAHAGREPVLATGIHAALPRLELTLLRRARQYRGARTQLERIVRDIVVLRPDHVVLSGDLTALGTNEELAAVRRALGSAGLDRKRLSVVPGNHDRYGPRGVAGRDFERHFGDLIASDLPEYADAGGYPFVRLVDDRLAVIGVDSTRVPLFVGYALGRVGARQLRRLDALLDDARLRERVVSIVVHHAPVDPRGRPGRLAGGLVDGPELMAVLDGRCASLHFGHVHRRFQVPATGGGGGPAGRPHVFCGGSSTEVGAEGYWLVELEARTGRTARARELAPGAALERPERRAA